MWTIGSKSRMNPFSESRSHSRRSGGVLLVATTYELERQIIHIIHLGETMRARKRQHKHLLNLNDWGDGFAYRPEFGQHADERIL